MRISALALAALSLVFFACKSDPERSRPRPFAELAKQCESDAELGCPRPIFNVADLRASQRYYRDALGFKIEWDHGDPPDFGAIRRGDALLFLSEGSQGKGGAWIMVFARDVDRLHAELRDRGALIKMPPTDMPWHLREMHVTDPDGNVIRFGSSLEHD